MDDSIFSPNQYQALSGLRSFMAEWQKARSGPDSVNFGRANV